MSVSTSLGSLRNLLPRSRRPRLARRTRHHGWSFRPAVLGLELRGTSLFVACVWPGVTRRWLSVTGVIEDVPNLSAEQLREKLRELAAGAAAEEPIVVLGLPRRELMVRHLTLPAAAEKSLANALNLQLGLYKPSDDEDFCWDAAVVRSNEQLAVSLAFVPRTRIEDLAAKLHDAGFPVSRLTTAQFSTIEWTLRAAADRDNLRLLLVQSRGMEMELALVDKGRCVVSRSFTRVAGDAASVASEVGKLLAAHRSSGSEPLTVVYAGADAAEWRSALTEFGETRELAQFCDAWSLTETVDGAPDEYWGAIALALDGLNWTGDYHLNLLPKELRATRRRWRDAPTYALLAANVLLLTMLAARGPIQRQITLRKYNHEIASIDRNASLVKRKIKKQEQIAARLAALQAFQERGTRPLDALSSVSQKLPPDAWLNVYTCKDQKIDISGTAKSASAVLPALKAIAQFDDVQFAGGLTRDTEGSERFHIQMKLKDMQ
jgi:Tfp pilus assembly protein PilN